MVTKESTQNRNFDLDCYVYGMSGKSDLTVLRFGDRDPGRVRFPMRWYDSNSVVLVERRLASLMHLRPNLLLLEGNF